MDAKEIYLAKMKEISERLIACSDYLEQNKIDDMFYSLESSILQLRKALECMALASIAPNHDDYANLRAQADKNPDYKRDYNGTKIVKALKKINKDFFPVPLTKATRIEGVWHFGRKTEGYLSCNKFESTYDRLGTLLHADNPWGFKKGFSNLAKDIPQIIEKTKALLVLHMTVIRSPTFTGVWIVEVPFSEQPPKVIVGQADGEFVVQ